MLKKKKIKVTSTERKIKYADGYKDNLAGTAKLPLKINKHLWNGDVFLIDEAPFEGIIGMDMLKALGVKINVKDETLEISENIEPVTSVYVHSARISVAEIEELNKGAKHKATPKQEQFFKRFLASKKTEFEKLRGVSDVMEHKIYLKPGTVPVKQRYYKMSPAKQQIAHQQVDELLEKGLIEESTSPWASPILLVEKKTKDYRMCVDYRTLNKSTIPNSFPLPHIRDIISKLKSSNFVSSLDLESGYHQIKMDKSSVPLTAFTVPGKGLYQYLVMPFGLCNAPATFQSVMESVLRPVLGKYCLVYLDDIIIFSETFEEHIHHLKEIFRLLLKAGFKINWKKCQFLKPYVEYLGHVVGQGEVRVVKKKVDAVLKMKRPKNQKEVRSFLGLVNWYRAFIKGCAEKAVPLSRLLQKHTKFKWGEEEQKSFDLLKKDLTEAPVLICPDFTKKFEIHVDASLTGLGAVLIQRKNRQERVVAYASRTLNRRERNWTTTERELLAIVYGIEHFREYVDGSEFTVITDHSALQWLHNLKNPSGKLARWIIRLSQYNFNIVHRKGKFNVVPDCLSRASYHETPPEDDKPADDVEIAAFNPEFRFFECYGSMVY